MHSLSKYYLIIRIGTICVFIGSLYNMFSCYGKQSLPDLNLVVPFLLLCIAAASQIVVDIVLRNPSTKALTAKSMVVVACLSLLTADIIDSSRHQYSVFLCVLTGAFLFFATLYSSQWLLNISKDFEASSKLLYYLMAHCIVCFFVILKEVGLDNSFATVFHLAFFIAAEETAYNYDIHDEFEEDSDR